tara:strand:- start:162 stop:461 length:300 start_codon:yes stop_codon:yes gene_type:complete
MKTPIHAITITVVILVFSWLMIERAKAESLELFVDDAPRKERNSVWKGDGSLVIIDNAENSGYVIKDGEVEYFVEPKDDGSPTFIYDDELIVCTNTGCY